MFSPPSRRSFLRLGATALLASAASCEQDRAASAANPADPALPLDNALPFRQKIPAPARIASIDVLRIGPSYFLRSTSTDGAVGLAITNDRLQDLLPLLQRRVIPYFLGKDARDLHQLVDGVYTHQSNYKYAGMAFWCCVGFVEFSLLDLLGNIARTSVGQLFGPVLRKSVPVYLSSMRRDTTPQQEVHWLAQRLNDTGANAVKLKIGGRMSKNADAAPGRTEQLIPLARRTFGDAVTIYVDANGSYDAPKAIEVGKMLEAHNVAFFEEPCPFDEYDQTRQVAQALHIPVAGGEQDTSIARFREIIQNAVLDILQPDLNYNGGFIRTIRVADLAATRRIPVTPHSPKSDPNEAYMLHFVSRTPNAGPYHEYDAAPRPKPPWFSPTMQVKNGALDVPDGPGLGITIDPQLLAKAQPL